MLKLLQGKKTYFVSATLVLYALIVVGWQGGDWQQAIQLTLGALGLSTVRAGIAKN